MYTFITIIIIVNLALIISACYYLNNKVVDQQESSDKPQDTFIEQAIIDETTDAPVEIDVVEAQDASIKKVVKHQEEVVEPMKKTTGRKTTRKSQNNAKLRNKRI